MASSSLSRFMTSLGFDDVEPRSWSESVIARFRSSSSEETSMTGTDSAIRARLSKVGPNEDSKSNER